MSIYVNIREKGRLLSNWMSSLKPDMRRWPCWADSGCGKSMTLRCIAGVVTPDEGVIRINGETVFDSEHKINLKPQQRQRGLFVPELRALSQYDGASEHCGGHGT